MNTEPETNSIDTTTAADPVSEAVIDIINDTMRAIKEQLSTYEDPDEQSKFFGRMLQGLSKLVGISVGINDPEPEACILNMMADMTNSMHEGKRIFAKTNAGAGDAANDETIHQGDAS